MKLSEECNEVGQRCAKQMAYGKFEVQSGQGFSNKERTRGEVLDMLVCIALLQRMGELDDITPEDICNHYANVLPKIRAMSQLAVNLGQVTPALMQSIPEELVL